MHKVLYCGQNIQEIQQIRNYLESRLSLSSDVSFDLAEAEALLESRPFHLFIWQTEEFHMDELTWINQLRSASYVNPILVICNEVNEGVKQPAALDGRLQILQKPYEFKALKGLTIKLIQAKSMPLQMFPRYRTNQKLAVESFASGRKIESSMFNLSVGGAYFESTHKTDAAVGDYVKMSVGLDDVGRSHEMNAQIVWTTRKGQYSGGYGVGVKFVKDEEIYKQLLEKF